MDGLIGATRGRAPEAGVWTGDAGETDPESEELESESEPERLRAWPIGMGSERGSLLSLEDIVKSVCIVYCKDGT